jgi:hypothetical protein
MTPTKKDIPAGTYPTRNPRLRAPARRKAGTPSPTQTHPHPRPTQTGQARRRSAQEKFRLAALGNHSRSHNPGCRPRPAPAARRTPSKQGNGGNPDANSGARASAQTGRSSPNLRPQCPSFSIATSSCPLPRTVAPNQRQTTHSAHQSPNPRSPTSRVS